VFTEVGVSCMESPWFRNKRSNRNHESQNVMSSARGMTRHANNGQANRINIALVQVIVPTLDMTAALWIIRIGWKISLLRAQLVWFMPFVMVLWRESGLLLLSEGGCGLEAATFMVCVCR